LNPADAATQREAAAIILAIAAKERAEDERAAGNARTDAPAID
jgi:hypothetical protein